MLNRKANEAAVAGFIRRWMESLHADGVSLAFSQGQHDHQKIPWLCELSDQAIWLDAKPGAVLEIEGCPIQGFDWTPADRLAIRLREEVQPNTAILFLHQVCDAFMGDVAMPELNFSQVPYVSLLGVGDYHEHRVLKTLGANGQSLTVLSPGSTCMQKINEPPIKHFFVIYDDLSFTSQPFLSRPFLDIPSILDTDGLEDFEATIGNQLDEVRDSAATAKLPESVRKPIVHVEFSLAVAGAHRRIMKAVGDRAHLFMPTTDPRRPTEAGAIKDEAARARRHEIAAKGLLGCLDQDVDRKREPVLYSLLHDLFTTDDPDAVIREKRKDYDLEAKGA
jgi:hypothetical protein